MPELRFEQLPRVAREAAVTAVGWRNRVRRFRGEFRVWRALLEESAGWDRDRRAAWQLQRLTELVAAARAGTRHYARALRDLGESWRAGDLRSALDALPVLEKSVLRADPAAFRNRRVREVAVTSTSGSTGAPMSVGHDARSIQRRFAFLHDQLGWAGVDLFDRSVRLSGRILCPVGVEQARPWLYNGAERQLFLSSYHLDDAHAGRIARKLDAFAPAVLDGYPSGVLATLRLLRDAGVRLASLKAIVTTAETLLPDVRDELASLSGAPVMDYYAASEGVPFIQQCPSGTYHVRWQSGIFEVADGARIGFEGDGELVVTSFVQDRTPLIRYRTGDLVRGLECEPGRACPCGLRTAVVAEVLGRVEDLVYTPDGRALGMFTYRTLKAIAGLGETQVIQHEYDRFEVNSVVTEAAQAPALEHAVQASFERALGYPVSLAFHPVERLPKGPNGKVRLVVSKVAGRAGR